MWMYPPIVNFFFHVLQRMTYKPYVAAAILVFTCFAATYASVERFTFPMPAVLLHDYVPSKQHPEAWGQTSARERLSMAANTQTARYPSRVP